jgi:hypothetical protein
VQDAVQSTGIVDSLLEPYDILINAALGIFRRFFFVKLLKIRLVVWRSRKYKHQSKSRTRDKGKKVRLV